MGRRESHLAIIAGILGLGIPSFAQVKSYPMSVNTSVAGESAVAAPAAGMVTRSGAKTISLKINNSCFPTNLRSVANPIAPSSIVHANLTVNIGGTDYAFTAAYPADLVTRAGMVNGTGTITSLGDKISVVPGGGTGGIFGNAVIINTGIPATVTVDNSGSVTTSATGDVYLKSVSFEQEITTCGGPPVYGSYGYSSFNPTYNCGEFMGKPGTLTASIGGLSVSSDKTNMEINVSFPGQTGFCGGYWSPLMVFFDDARPKFTNVSDFPLYPGAKTSWPEANSPGWFVGLDDGTGAITKKDQLFGDKEGGPENGFEALKALDSNHDGVIDKRDKDFKKLVLWRDTNGDGVSQKTEIVKLSSKIQKISLKYNSDTIRALGSYAQERQRSKFWYKDAKGKSRQGDIIDIWLSPAQPLTVTQK